MAFMYSIYSKISSEMFVSCRLVTGSHCSNCSTYVSISYIQSTSSAGPRSGENCSTSQVAKAVALTSSVYTTPSLSWMGGSSYVQPASRRFHFPRACHSFSSVRQTLLPSSNPVLRQLPFDLLVSPVASCISPG